MRLRPDLHAGPCWGNLQHSSRPLSWIKGGQGRGRGGRRRDDREAKGKGGRTVKGRRGEGWREAFPHFLFYSLTTATVYLCVCHIVVCCAGRQRGEDNQHESAAARGAAAQDRAEDSRRHKEEDGPHQRTAHEGTQQAHSRTGRADTGQTTGSGTADLPGTHRPLRGSAQLTCTAHSLTNTQCN